MRKREQHDVAKVEEGVGDEGMLGSRNTESLGVFSVYFSTLMRWRKWTTGKGEKRVEEEERGGCGVNSVMWVVVGVQAMWRHLLYIDFTWLYSWGRHLHKLAGEKKPRVNVTRHKTSNNCCCHVTAIYVSVRCGYVAVVATTVLQALCSLKPIRGCKVNDLISRHWPLKGITLNASVLLETVET